MKENAARRALLYALLAVLFWSTIPTAFKLGLQHCSTWQLLTGATLVSTLVLGILTALSGKLPSLLGYTKKDLLPEKLKGKKYYN